MIGVVGVQIADRDQTSDFAVRVNDRQMADAVLLEGVSRIIDGSIGSAIGDLRRHDVRYGDRIRRPFGCDDAPQDVTFRKDSDQTTIVDDQQGSDGMLIHALGGGEHGFFGPSVSQGGALLLIEDFADGSHDLDSSSGEGAA